MLSIGLAITAMPRLGQALPPQPDSAPVFTSAPSLTLVEEQADSMRFALSHGSAAGQPWPSLVGRLTLDGTDVTAGINGESFQVAKSDAGQSLVWTVTARNGVIPEAVVSATAYVPAANQASEPVTLRDFSRDRSLFDGGLAVGDDAATVPLSGTATPGAAIEARAISIDDAGAASTAWEQIASADSDGAWQGQVSVPIASSWYRAAVRDAADPSVVATTSNRFGVGLIVSFHEQSNLAQLLVSSYDVPSMNANVRDQESVQVIEIENRGRPDEPDTGIPGPFRRITPGNPQTTALSHMAEQIQQAAPGLKVLLVMDAKAGVAQNASLDDTDTRRRFEAVQALFDKVRSDGAEIGLMVQSHTNNIAGDSYAAYLARSVLGRTLGGAPVPQDATGRYIFDDRTNPVKGDHLWSEVLPGLLTGRTRVVVADSGFGWPSGSSSENDDFFRAAVDLQNNPALSPNPFVAGLRHNNIRLGSLEDPSADTSHFTTDSLWGKPNSARQRVVTALEAAGIIEFPTPVFDQVEWTEDYVQLGSSAGPVTTIALQRGLPALDQTDHPDFTRVLGFRFNDAEQARVTEIVDPDTGSPAQSGVVRIYANDGGTFDASSRLYFRRYSGAGEFPISAYFSSEAYLHKPVVMVGPEGFEAIEVQPSYDVSALMATNQLAGDDEATFLMDGAGKFTGPYLPSTGTLTIETRLRYSPGNDQGSLLWGNTAFHVYMRPDQNDLKVMVRKADRNIAFDRSTRNEFADMEGLHTVRVVVDLPGKIVRLFYDDVEYTDAGFGQVGAVNAGLMSTILNNNINILGRQNAEVAYFRMWLRAEPDGGTPATAPWLEIAAQPGGAITMTNAQFQALS